MYGKCPSAFLVVVVVIADAAASAAAASVVDVLLDVDVLLGDIVIILGERNNPRLNFLFLWRVRLFPGDTVTEMALASN